MLREEKKTQLSAYVLLLSEVEHIVERISRLKAEHWKTQYIGGSVDLTAGQIDCVDTFIVCNEDINFARRSNALGL